MVNGGDYYLGKDGKPYYPKNKTKPKPIPVAKYFFYTSPAPVSDKEIQKLTRGNCFDALILSRNPNQEVILMTAVPDYVYIVGKDSFYSSAEKFFLWEKRFPPSWVTKPINKIKELTLESIFTEVYSLNGPYRNINIVSHANEHGWLGFSLKLKKSVKVKGQLVEKTINKRVSYYSLKEKIEQGELEDLSNKLAAAHKVIIRGCNVGENTDMLNLLKKAFGNKCPVYAPTHKQHYQWFEKGDKKKAWENFNTYWLRFQGVAKKNREQLKTGFEEKYPQVKTKLWNGYVRLAKRKIVSLPTNYMIRFRHPPDLNPKPCLAFAKNYWKNYFQQNKQMPSSFLRREGPKNVINEKGKTFEAYEYYFKGKFFCSDEKSWVNGTFSLRFEIYPQEADVYRKEKARHPHPEWYEWEMSYKNKGKFVKIAPVARMTIYQIRKPIIDEKGEYLKADLSNSKYWGRSI
jgi:hypothetical protein